MAFKDLTLFNCFVQADFVRGFRYLDDAGKIMNRWDDEFPKKSVGIEGLHMQNPTAAHLIEARIDVTKAWISIRKPPTITFAMDHGYNFIEEVSSILGVEHFKRTAMRLQYIHPLETGSPTAQRLAAMMVPKVGNIFENSGEVSVVDFSVRIDDPILSSRVAIGVIKKDEEGQHPDDFPPYALIFDADLFSLERIEATRASLILKRIPGWIDKQLRPLVEECMESVL